MIPNIPLDDVPVGADEHANVLKHKVGKTPTRPNWVKEHFEIGEALGMMDFERAAKLSGSRFTVLKGQLARLERALGQFMLDLHTTEHGYEEVQPPLMVQRRGDVRHRAVAEVRGGSVCNRSKARRCQDDIAIGAASELEAASDRFEAHCETGSQ